MLTYDDIRNQRKFPDAALKRSARDRLDFSGERPKQFKFDVPYRSFLAKKVDNLLLAGESVSFEHYALFHSMRAFGPSLQTGEGDFNDQCIRRTAEVFRPVRAERVEVSGFHLAFQCLGEAQILQLRVFRETQLAVAVDPGGLHPTGIIERAVDLWGLLDERTVDLQLRRAVGKNWDRKNQTPDSNCSRILCAHEPH